jgi:hypothetical protein
MQLSKTLIHKLAMPIALEAVRTFGIVSPKSCFLEIHSDGSLDQGDAAALERAAGNLNKRIVFPEEREEKLAPVLKDYPLSRSLISRRGYMTKVELFACSETPFFYFDSDIVWLRPFKPITPVNEKSVFSTETWSWYYGMSRPIEWIREKIPARINSGFAFINSPFPFKRLETMLEKGLFNPENQGAGDQELFAFLFPDTLVFSLKDFTRSRVGVVYDLRKLGSVALHFPGRMWESHLDQIQVFQPDTSHPPKNLECLQPKRLNCYEVAKMNLVRYAQVNSLFEKGVGLYRKIRKIWHGRHYR